jgi:hypothetical protein
MSFKDALNVDNYLIGDEESHYSDHDLKVTTDLSSLFPDVMQKDEEEEEEYDEVDDTIYLHATLGTLPSLLSPVLCYTSVHLLTQFRTTQ